MAAQSKKRRNKNSPAKKSYDIERRDIKNKAKKRAKHLKKHPNDKQNGAKPSYKRGV